MSKATEVDGVVGAPILETTYTSGSGTHTPTAGAAWLEVILQAAGGGGARSATAGQASGGGAGEWMRAVIPVNGAMAYQVGAAGVGATVNGNPGTAGGNTVLGHLIVFGGRPGVQISAGGTLSGAGGGATLYPAGARIGSVPGGAGGGYHHGGGVTASAGRAAGMPQPIPSGTDSTVAASAAEFGGGAGGGINTGGAGGGSSVLGQGGGGSTGSGVAVTAATGYGAGGGGGHNTNGGNGTGGLIIIREYAA